jgi:protein gp37
MAKRLSHVAAAAAARGKSAGRTDHYRGVVDKRGRWNGNVYLAEEALADPYRWLTKRPHLAAAFAPKLDWSPNIWMGTSVEDALVTYRIRDLQKIKAHVRFLSVEPLLGPIPRLALSGIHWVIVGGESGPGARPMESAWVLQIKNRCVANNVPFFFKQWGGVNKKATGRELEGRTWDQMPRQVAISGGIRFGAQG